MQIANECLCNARIPPEVWMGMLARLELVQIRGVCPNWKEQVKSFFKARDEKWRRTLADGMHVDALDHIGKWHEGVVVGTPTRRDNASMQHTLTCTKERKPHFYDNENIGDSPVVHVHFLGWRDKWDILVSRDSNCIQYPNSVLVNWRNALKPGSVLEYSPNWYDQTNTPLWYPSVVVSGTTKCGFTIQYKGDVFTCTATVLGSEECISKPHTHVNQRHFEMLR